MKGRREINEASSPAAVASSPERISRPWDRQEEPRRSQGGPRAEEVQRRPPRPWRRDSQDTVPRRRELPRERERWRAQKGLAPGQGPFSPRLRAALVPPRRS